MKSIFDRYIYLATYLVIKLVVYYTCTVVSVSAVGLIGTGEFCDNYVLPKHFLRIASCLKPGSHLHS